MSHKSKHRKIEYKEVEIDGQTFVATRYEGNTHWVVDVDNQEDIKQNKEQENGSI